MAFGDTRFHDPTDTEAANPAIRHALVAAIDKENPAFVSIGGDIVYSGEMRKDWQVWDSETAIGGTQDPCLSSNWQPRPERQCADCAGELLCALSELQQSRFYSVNMGNAIMLVLDSALDEISGPQGEWLKRGA